MNFHRILLCESLPAIFALEMFLTSMSYFMTLQDGVCGKILIARGALEALLLILSDALLSVYLEGSLIKEDFTTFGAGEVFTLKMCLYVTTDAGRAIKDNPAPGALHWGFFVNQSVKHEIVLREKS